MANTLPQIPPNRSVDLPKAEYNDECSISFEPLHELAKRGELVMTQCGHKFSRAAIVDWLQRDPTCPYRCKGNIDAKNLVPVVIKVEDVAAKALDSKEKEKDEKTKRKFSTVDFNGNYSQEEALQIALAISTSDKSSSSSSSSNSNSSKTETIEAAKPVARNKAEEAAEKLKKMLTEEYQMKESCKRVPKITFEEPVPPNPMGYKARKIPICEFDNCEVINEAALYHYFDYFLKKPSAEALSPERLSSLRCLTNPNVDAKLKESLAVDKYRSFREIERPSLSHESLELLALRVSTAHDYISAYPSDHDSEILFAAKFYLQAGVILRITKEDGKWGRDVIIQKLEDLVSEVSQYNGKMILRPDVPVYMRSILPEIKGILGAIKMFKSHAASSYYNGLLKNEIVIEGDHNSLLKWTDIGNPHINGTVKVMSLQRCFCPKMTENS